MKQKKKAAARTTARTKTERKVLKAEAGAAKRPRYLPDELAGMYRPVKRPVTLRLDADILAWFQKAGRGYQTRINQALRTAMMAQRRAK